MRNIFFDICSIPLFVMILWVCVSRKMTKGSQNQMFITLTAVSLVCALADLFMELIVCQTPLNNLQIIAASALSYTYKLLRNSSIAIFFLLILSLTRTTTLIEKRWEKIVFSLPFCVAVLVLVQNLFTHNVFSVTALEGYRRGPLLMIHYAIAGIYAVAGTVYCVYCRRYLAMKKWISLLSLYIFAFAAIVVQYFRPDLLVEMFFTAIGEMMIMLMVMRPEERMDSDVGMQSWEAYRNDLHNILLSGEHVQIIVIRMLNCREIRTYLGDHNYNACLTEIARQIRAIPWKHPNRVWPYFERPGTIYLIGDAGETDVAEFSSKLLNETGNRIRAFADMGVRFEPRICVIRCPEDLTKMEDVINLGHKFNTIDRRNQIIFRAEEIVHSRNFAVETHMDEILNRAIRDKRLEMHYQPIYDVKSGAFHSAEALARINDAVYGEIMPGSFIPAAETLGMIVPLGNLVLDSVFRFVSEHDLKQLGVSYIELNLSVAQCMQSDLPEQIGALQEKYGVDPKQISLEITETTFNNISEVMLQNVDRLIEMGYSFALDDYGIGYSSIQRVNHLPLDIIKIDKSMLDEISSASGRSILQHTVQMMQSINKKLVVEGAETKEAVDALEEMHCDYIQGFYFSRPLKQSDYISFVRKHNCPAQEEHTAPVKA